LYSPPVTPREPGIPEALLKAYALSGEAKSMKQKIEKRKRETKELFNFKFCALDFLLEIARFEQG